MVFPVHLDDDPNAARKKHQKVHSLTSKSLAGTDRQFLERVRVVVQVDLWDERRHVRPIVRRIAAAVGLEQHALTRAVRAQRTS